MKINCYFMIKTHNFINENIYIYFLNIKKYYVDIKDLLIKIF